jgi:uncharacterized damage-inducible protein DinB
MNIPETYDYLVRARRDLWTALESVPDAMLSLPMLHGGELRCIKDLVFHIAGVEDFWIHEDILRDEPVLHTNVALKDLRGGAVCANFAIETLVDYWHAVEQSTLALLGGLKEQGLGRAVALHDSPDERYTLDGLLWHVMLHEVRHTAQIVMMLRMQGIKPPSLDLLFYLPGA